MKFRKNDRVLLISEKGHRYIQKVNQSFFTQDGELKLKSLVGKNWGSIIKTNKGIIYRALSPNFADLKLKATRAPQAILPKDIGMILAYTGIGPGSKVLDAGAGSGILASSIAKIVYPEKLTTYEVRTDFLKVAKSNFEFFGIKNIQIKNKDIYKGIDESGLDLITLDLPEPWKVKDIKKALKVGGYVISYVPQVTQVSDFVKFCEKEELMVERVVELIERSWKIRGRIARPEHQMLGHTAFLIFARRIH